MNALLFPGQGSQKVGMGLEICDKFEKAGEILERASAVTGIDLREIMFCGPENKLTDTRFAQVAIYTTSAMYLEKLKANGTDYSYVAGHSLGEYSALFAAGVFDFETGLRLVNKRAELMSAMNGKGIMAAVLGLSEDELGSLMEDASGKAEKDGVGSRIPDPSKNHQEKDSFEFGRDVVMANLNSKTQIVISGTEEAVNRIGQRILAKYDNDSVKFKKLNVSAAFHSPQMREAAEKMKTFIEKTPFNEPECFVVPNVSGIPAKSADEIKRCLIAQITGQVRWYDTVLALKNAGVSMFYEVGFGDTLKKLNKTIVFRPKCSGVQLD